MAEKEARQGGRWPRIDSGRPLVFLACAIILIDAVGYGVVVPVLPLYSRELGVSEFGLGFLFASYAIALLVASVPLGLLSDRIGRKPLVLFGMFGTMAASIMYAYAGTYAQLLGARVLDGVTNAATWTAALALVGDRVEESRMGRSMGYLISAMAVGGIAGPLVGGVLSDAVGYKFPFFVIAGACLAGGVLGLFLHEDRSFLTGSQVSMRGMLAGVLRKKGVLVACLVTLLTTTGIGLIEPTLPLYLDQEFSMSRSGIGILFGILMVCYAVASPAAGRVSDRFGRKGPVMAGLLATAVLVPFLGIVGSVALMCVLLGLLGISFASFETPILPLVTEELAGGAGDGGTRHGTAFSLLNVSWSAGYAVGPLIGGAVMGWLGFLPALLIYSVMLLALSVFAVREL